MLQQPATWTWLRLLQRCGKWMLQAQWLLQQGKAGSVSVAATCNLNMLFKLQLPAARECCRLSKCCNKGSMWCIIIMYSMWLLQQHEVGDRHSNCCNRGRPGRLGKVIVATIEVCIVQASSATWLLQQLEAGGGPDAGLVNVATAWGRGRQLWVGNCCNKGQSLHLPCMLQDNFYANYSTCCSNMAALPAYTSKGKHCKHCRISNYNTKDCHWLRSPKCGSCGRFRHESADCESKQKNK